ALGDVTPGGASPPGSGDALGDLAGLNAAGAHVDALGSPVHHGADALDVGVPPTLGAPVRVADVHPEGRVLPAHLAHCCHRRRPLHLWDVGDLPPRRRGPSDGPREAIGAPGPPPTRERAPRGGSCSGWSPTSYNPRPMATLTRLGADELRAAVATFRDALAAHKEGINRLNVYPVPDGDTGTNMALTALAVCEELERCDAELASVCKAISHGSLMGARGNSGVILSQILRG